MLLPYYQQIRFCNLKLKKIQKFYQKNSNFQKLFRQKNSQTRFCGRNLLHLKIFAHPVYILCKPSSIQKFQDNQEVLKIVDSIDVNSGLRTLEESNNVILRRYEDHKANENVDEVAKQVPFIRPYNFYCSAKVITNWPPKSRCPTNLQNGVKYSQ